ncbi:uncharacterized protein LOC103315949 [Nasonia vitripennis]|uniref:Uncharacterized protein n=1 Tax=Nasonia vitripennis TaxID=7425 RepID=A0A7M7PV06_NASVI|nr:uncharacterized protein LOC103315949 [Nasonia vitripennis]
MRNDKIVRAIKYDELIIEYGNEICSHLREQQHKTNICTQLRRLSRLKLKLNVKNLVDALITSRSLDVLAAIEALASSSEDDGNGQTLAYPTVAQNLATLVKQVAHTQKLMYVRKHDLNSANRMQNFIELFANDYKLRLSRMAAESHGIRRRQRNTELPSADDISTLMYHLKSVMQENYNILINGLNEDAYFMLQKACLSTLQVWNRKRPGDVERILVNDFKNLKEMSNSQIKEFDNLSNNLKDLSQEFSLLYTRGKLGNDIKLLVSADVKLCVNLLLEHRDNDQLKISPKNPYLFALSQTPIYAIRHPSAYSVLSTFSKECGAEKPYLLRATRMRKQLATACIRLNLNDMELSDLAGYMGHHVNIHKSHYRQNIVDRDIPLFLKFINTALTSDVSEPICTELDTTAGNEKSVIEEEIEEEAAEQEIDEASKSIDYEKKPKNQKAKSLRFNAPVIELPKKVVKEVKKKVKWSKLECDTVYKTFEDFIVGNSTNAPTIPQCKALKEKHSELFQDRFVNPASIKAWVFAQRKRCGNQ